jgi:hypothetical protein
MEKLVRPVDVDSRRWLESTSSTMAVDDKARHAPMMMEAPAPLPASATIPAMTAVDSTTCRVPSPNTSRRMVKRRSIDSSMPIRNRRNTTPRSAMGETLLASTTVTHLSSGIAVLKLPSPSGPRMAPAPR